MKCFICKDELDPNAPLEETVRLKLPNGTEDYVHTRHVGIDVEVKRQQKAGLD